MEDLKRRLQYKRAVALEFDAKNGGVPKIGAQGEMLNADEVVRIARRYGIPVVERDLLAQALSKLESGEEIPPELYEAVAAVLVELSDTSVK